MGSGGMVAAEFASTLGLRVGVVERDRVGGDCLWTGCVPSKALLASAKAAHTIRHADRYGLEASEPRIDTARVWQRIRSIQQELAGSDDDPQRFIDMGVDIHFGAARMVDVDRVAVDGGDELEARFVLLCTGGRPAVPAIGGLEDVGYLTSESLFELERAPESLTVIGGGPVGVELAQGCARLGISTTLLQRGKRILPRDEPEMSTRLAAIIVGEGVDLVLDARVEAAAAEAGMKVLSGTAAGEPRTWRSHELLVAAGRRPNVEALGLEEVGVKVGPHGVVVDANMRTAVKSIYAVGDLAGRFLFTHAAGYEAVSAVRNAFLPGRSAAPDFVPWTTFTDPELAHAGLTEAEAIEEHGADRVQVWRQDLIHSDRARVEGATEGAIAVVTARDRVVGAHALAPSAGELIHELALAIRQNLKLTEVAGLVHVYPTLSTAVGQLAGEAAYESAQRYRWLVRSSAG